MIVDVHAHYHPRAYTEALSRIPGISRGGFRGGNHDTDESSSVQERLEMMDAAGVSLQVLSPAAGRAPYGEDEASTVEAARVGNDLTAELVSRYPDRFAAYVSLPLPHVDASLREMARGLDELGMLGVNIHCSVLNRSIAGSEFEPIYAELNRRQAVVFFHPTGNGICSPFITEFGLGPAVGTSLEDATAALHLVAAKIPSRYPDITFVVPHLGGPLPMLLERLDRQFSMQARDLPEPPSVTLRRFYYDTVGHASHAALLCAYHAFGADHLVPGSDFPVLLAWESYAETFSWIRQVPLPPDAIDQILDRSAAAVLKLPG
jgi:predicted TIM-barrel fold metal-dependent hydrolase